MNKNVGINDRMIRGTIGVVLAVLYATGRVSASWGLAVLIIAVILILTAVISWCPLYQIIGLRTSKPPKQ